MSPEKQIIELKLLVRDLLPFARLYTPPDDFPEQQFEREVEKIKRLIARAEKASAW